MRQKDLKGHIWKINVCEVFPLSPPTFTLEIYLCIMQGCESPKKDKFTIYYAGIFKATFSYKKN